MNWYYSKEGKAEGPLTLDSIGQLIAKGEITGTTSIFKEGQTGWIKAAEALELHPFLQKKTAQPPPESKKTKSWVILVKSLEDTSLGKNKFSQKGPFVGEVVLQMIQKGEVKWTDHAWAPGMKSWTRLSEISELAPESRREVSHQSPNEAIHMEPESPGDSEGGRNPSMQINSEAPSPTGVDSKLETAPGAGVEAQSDVQLEATKTAETAKSEADLANESSATVTEVKNREATASFNRVRIYGWSLASAVVLVVLFLVVESFNSGRQDRVELPVESPVTPVQGEVAAERELDKSAEPAKAVDSVVASTPAVPAPAPEPAKFINIVPLKMDSKSPRLAIETNVSPGDKISVRFTSLPNKILDLVRFEKEVKLAREEKTVPSVELGKWGLPSGSYQVTVESGDLKETKQVFVGKKNRQFQAQLDKHVRKMGLQKSAEAQELKKFVSSVERLTTKIAKDKRSKSNIKGWATKWNKEIEKTQQGLISKFQPQNSNRYVYPDQILLAREIVEDLKQAVRKTELSGERAPASVPGLQKVNDRIKSLRKKVD